MSKNLGIYLSRERAVAAVTTSLGGSLQILECFTVTLEAKADQDCPTLAAQISAELASRSVEFDSVSITIDCTLYTQHDVNSRFTDLKQIARTIRFDVEEVIGDDANRMAIAFSIVKNVEDGSVVTVYSAMKDELRSILKDFQDHNIDPEVIEPDLISFSRAISYVMKDDSDHSPIFVAFNDTICYNAIMNSSHSRPVLRSFLYAESLDKTALLKRQLKLTLARNSISVPVDTLCVLNKDVDRDQLAAACDLLVPSPDEMLKDETRLFADSTDADISHAIAAAASMAPFSKKLIDFRQDFAPYQGKKRIAEISLRMLTLALAILICVFAFNHTVDMLKIKSNIVKVEQRTEEEYSSAMKGKSMPDKGVLILKGEVNKLRRINSGEESGDDNSISSRLQYVLEAINSTPPDINLEINSITVSEGMMRIDGSTNSRANTQKMLAAIDNHKKLKRAQESLQQNGAVDSFSVNIDFVK
ncbi:MAG: hypothetical protein ACIAQZ_07295 [Sedimentisphaeraceae bacterium JB056]